MPLQTKRSGLYKLKYLNRHAPLFLSSIAYSLLVARFQQKVDIIVTIFFLIFLIWLFISRKNEISERFSESDLIVDLVLHQICISSGILLGFVLVSENASLLWPQDAFTSHLPISENVSLALRGEIEWSKVGLDQPGTIIHLFTGLWFFLIGKTVYATTLSLLCFKLITICIVFLFCRNIENAKTAYLSGLTYILAPTVLFYTTTFYKEASVHSLVALIFYFSHLVFVKNKYWLLIPLGMFFYFLSRERFYLVFLFIPSLLTLGLFASNKHRWLKAALSGSILLFLYQENVYLQQSPEWVIRRLETFRQDHMKFNDYHYKYNYEIPYFLAFLKSLFTPYFTFNKLKIYFDYSNLLTWGSFLNQVIILSACIAFFKNFKNKVAHHLWICMPLFFLLLFLAYISPWAARLETASIPSLPFILGYFFQIHITKRF